MDDGFREDCIKCSHNILKFEEYPDCDCGCHSDMRASLNSYLGQGKTKEDFMAGLKKTIDHHRTVHNVLDSGLFK